MSNEKSICGSTNTRSGDPCQNPSGSCPHEHHKPDGDPDARGSGGRPLKLTDPDLNIQERMASYIEDGESIIAASRLCGIDDSTHRKWMNRGKEQDEGPFNEYYSRLSRALGHAEREKRAKTWEMAVKNNDSRTMLRMLGRRHPKSWGKPNANTQTDDETSSDWLEELRAAQEHNQKAYEHTEAAAEKAPPKSSN